MQLFDESGDIDRAIAELNEAFGNIAARIDIDRLRSQIEKRAAQHKNTVLLRNRLCQAMAAQIGREIAAA